MLYYRKCYECGFELRGADDPICELRIRSHLMNCEEVRALMIDLETYKKFSFKDYPYYFRWKEPEGALVYIFETRESKLAVSASPLNLDTEPSFDNAKETARRFIKGREALRNNAQVRK